MYYHANRIAIIVVKKKLCRPSKKYLPAVQGKLRSAYRKRNGDGRSKIGSEKGQGRIRIGRRKIRNRHADKPYPFVCRQYAANERKAQVMKPFPAGHGSRIAAAARDLREILVFHLHGDCASERLGLFTPCPDVVGLSEHAGFDVRLVGESAVERGLAAR